MFAVILAVLVLAGCHLVLGVVSVGVGVIASIQAEVWLAHTVSPIWSGGFFIITGILGFACARKKTSYVILCFTAFSIVSLVTAVVSIQLLRLGLVNHTTDGHTFQKAEKDILIIIALVDAGAECLVCIISSFVSCRVAKLAKKELFKKREGTFHVQDEAYMNGIYGNDIYGNGNYENGNYVSNYFQENNAFMTDGSRFTFSEHDIELQVEGDSGETITPEIDGLSAPIQKHKRENPDKKHEKSIRFTLPTDIECQENG
ncbi:unnamed protein product [Owenia fusiformis]|uniref:Transmembrane protein 196 n=1 Tax=Owenia fusiformis TaxID=6347 RepID=A0A8J1U7U9_OWEFU|nr:unnamed protein product [Owenia fusiformis]